MSIQLEPSELGFRRPLIYEATQLLRLRNPGGDPIAFKVKTTAPKQYCVRPNSGRIEPGGEIQVQVILQAMRTDPPPDAKCRDKFLVQSVVIAPEREKLDATAIWQDVEKFSKNDIQERKIRVVFLQAEGGPIHDQSYVNGTHDEAPPAYRSPSPQYNSPGPDASTPSNRTAATSSASGSYAYPQLHDSKEPGSRQDSAPTTASNIQSTFSGAASSVASVIPTSGEDVRAQLSEAKATIAKLLQQGEERGLRQGKDGDGSLDTKGQSPSGTTATAIQQHTSEGVPVQIVAALCLLSFLLAYIFF